MKKIPKKKERKIFVFMEIKFITNRIMSVMVRIVENNIFHIYLVFVYKKKRLFVLHIWKKLIMVEYASKLILEVIIIGPSFCIRDEMEEHISESSFPFCINGINFFTCFLDRCVKIFEDLIAKKIDIISWKFNPVSGVKYIFPFFNGSIWNIIELICPDLVTHDTVEFYACKLIGHAWMEIDLQIFTDIFYYWFRICY